MCTIFRMKKEDNLITLKWTQVPLLSLKERHCMAHHLIHRHMMAVYKLSDDLLLVTEQESQIVTKFLDYILSPSLFFTSVSGFSKKGRGHKLKWFNSGIAYLASIAMMCQCFGRLKNTVASMLSCNWIISSSGIGLVALSALLLPGQIDQLMNLWRNPKP